MNTTTNQLTFANRDTANAISVDATAVGLTGVASDPVQSREHILIAQLLLNSWTAGKDLDLAGLILQIQNPPIRTVGGFCI